jgi:hypothetical protein
MFALFFFLLFSKVSFLRNSKFVSVELMAMWFPTLRLEEKGMGAILSCAMETGQSSSGLPSPLLQSQLTNPISPAQW